MDLMTPSYLCFCILFQGMKVTFTFIITTVLVTLCAASVCPPGDKYWNPSLESCVNCTRCDLQVHVVLRPCEVHRDTVCGPLSDLQIDLGWISNHHTRHHGRHHGKHHRQREEERERNAGINEVGYLHIYWFFVGCNSFD